MVVFPFFKFSGNVITIVSKIYFEKSETNL